MTVLDVCWRHCQVIIRSRFHDNRGASLVEYALLVALIAAVCVGAVTFIGNATSESLDSSASQLDSP